MRRVLASAVAVVAVAFGMAGPAHAETSTAFCEPPGLGDQAAVSGVGTWTPPVTATSLAHVWNMSLTARCEVGTGHDVGIYHFGLSGSSNENCAGGFGEGVVQGTGPGNTSIQGTVMFEKVGIHYYMNGTFLAGGHTHRLNLWLDVIPAVDCSYSVTNVFGHGMVESNDLL